MLGERTTTDCPYHVQDTAVTVRNGFPYFSHHDSVSALWANKWRTSSAAGIYPFVDGDVADFDPVFAELSTMSDDDPAILYRPDEYAKPFLAVAQSLAGAAQTTRDQGNLADARDGFLRAAAVYRIARFPINRSPLTQVAWELGKVAYELGGKLLNPPSVPIGIPFTHADTSAGDRDGVIACYLRIPTTPRPKKGWPVLLFICGLDAYRTDHTNRTQEHVDRGYATLSFEIPGTGDCPAAPTDPTSPDRLLSSLIDWVWSAGAAHYDFDPETIVARGVSTGGYYAFRAAHTHSDKLFAVVSQGGGCHHMFDPQWIAAQNQMEYPFALSDGLAYKFGYRDADPAIAKAHYAADGHKFSLVDSGIAETPTCRLLAINGMEDSIFPIEDSLLIAIRGDKKDLLVRGNRGHMGNPGAEELVYDWIDDRVAQTA